MEKISSSTRITGCWWGKKKGKKSTNVIMLFWAVRARVTWVRQGGDKSLRAQVSGVLAGALCPLQGAALRDVAKLEQVRRKGCRVIRDGGGNDL